MACSQGPHAGARAVPIDSPCQLCPIAAEERTFKKPNDGCASSRHMRRYREPFPVLLRPAIGVAPVRLLSVRRGVTGRRMDDGEVAHDADLYIMRLQILDRHRLRGLLKEGGTVDQRFVGI